MTEWVAKSVVLAIHDAQLAEHGGASGLRDGALLDAALARSRRLLTYTDPAPDIAALAAAYAYGIAKDHPFVDGNKRTSYGVTRTFLVLNGYDLTADDPTLLDMWVRLGDGRMSEAECAEWIRARIGKP